MPTCANPRAAAAQDEPHRVSGQDASDAFDVVPHAVPDVMVPIQRPSVQPRGGSGREDLCLRAHQDQHAARGRDGIGSFAELALRGSDSGIVFGARDDEHEVRLAQAAPGPFRCLGVGSVEHEALFGFLFRQPVGQTNVDFSLRSRGGGTDAAELRIDPLCIQKEARPDTRERR